MSATDATTTEHVAHVEPAAHEEHPAHPSDWVYIKVALILAVLTGIEVFTYFHSVLDWGRVLMPALIVLMIVKFYLIAAYFMHLKFDQKVLRRAFIAGIILALGVYLIALTTFRFFGDWA